MSVSIWTRRAYEAPTQNDGYRVLVDHVWPRGVSKDDLDLDDWRKDVAPSDGLRRWFDHDPERWEAFRARYAEELDEKDEATAPLLEKAREGRVTLVYAARDTEHNNAVALKGWLERKLRGSGDA